MNLRTGSAAFGSPGRLTAALGSGVTLAVLLTLADPGLTIDEPLDVRPGRAYVAALVQQGWHFFDRRVVDRVFGDNAEHPPLGRWLLGLASLGAQPLEVRFTGGLDPTGTYVLAGRVAPALVLGALVGLVTLAAARRYGAGAGFAAGYSLLAMPRVFAHGHLAALDTFLCFFWILALLTAEAAVRNRHPVAAGAAAGCALGLALLTKIHAWFLLPIVLAWACFRLGIRRGAAAWVVWAATGTILFFVGWPWLWYDTVGRVARFLGTGVHRMPLRVLYFGIVYDDFDVPWHYPWFYFAATVPVGLQALGTLGLVAAWRNRRTDPFLLLLVGSIGVFLVLFSTRIPVYDGERLFLVVFPLWAILVARGFAAAWACLGERLPRRWARWSRPGLVALLMAQAYGTATLHPFGLSYYNLLVGGLPGAERCGLELTYWSDAVDRVLLDDLTRRAAPNASAALVPTLYPQQGLLTTTRPLFDRGILLQDETAAPSADWVIISRRTAYWPGPLRNRIAGRQPVATRSRQRVWLSGLWSFAGDSQRADRSAESVLHTGPQVASPKLQAPSGHPGDDQ
jgi:4-amino-4-deoxy-L-arabinose transferase-like glycosyltransferase